MDFHLVTLEALFENTMNRAFALQYAEKVRELSRFIEPLRQKIAAMGREEDEKLAKMRRLLEILCNPNKRLPMDTLKKCEAVLYRMQQTQDLGTFRELQSAALGQSKGFATVFLAVLQAGRLMPQNGRKW